MSYYWGKFKRINNDIFRFDTRVYLSSIKNSSDTDICIGAIVGKNPGSASPSCLNYGGLQSIELDGDQLLPNVRSIFLKAYQSVGKPVKYNAYIQILNLMNICDKNLSQAINRISSYPTTLLCDSEKRKFPFLWYVWGADNKNLNLFKERFSNINASIHFYLDTKTQKIVSNAPKLKDSARHTQGLSHELVVPYISKII